MLPDDVDALPQHGVSDFVLRLAAHPGLVYERTALDDFAEAVARLSGDDVQLDQTCELIVALRNAGVSAGPKVIRLVTNHLREKAA